MGLLGKCDVVRKTCGKGINRHGGANVPQREHRTITLKQRQLRVEQLQSAALLRWMLWRPQPCRQGGRKSEVQVDRDVGLQ